MNKEKEEMLEKLRNVKAMENNNLSINGLEDEVQIEDVRFLGQATIIEEIEGEKVEKEINIYAVLEGKNIKYYSDDMCLGYKTEGVGIIPSPEYQKKYEENSPIKDVVEKLKEKEMLEQEKPQEEKTVQSLEKLEEENMEEYADIAGIDKKDIKEVNELNLGQKLKKEKKEEKEGDSINKNVADSLSTKEETDLNQEIKGETLRTVLGLSSEYKKIAIVSTSQVNKYTNPEKLQSTIDSFVAIKANGEAIVLGEDIIKQDKQKGRNSTFEDLTVNVDGEVNYEQNTSSYEIVKSPGLYLKVGYDENIGKEIKIEDRSKQYGKEGITYELETSSTWRADDDLRRMQKEKAGEYAADNAIEKQKKHEELGCQNDRVENIDNHEENNDHDHIEMTITKDSIVPGRDMTIEEWAEKLGENTDVIIDRYKREMEKNPKKELEHIANEIEDDYKRFKSLEHKI